MADVTRRSGKEQPAGVSPTTPHLSHTQHDAPLIDEKLPAPDRDHKKEGVAVVALPCWALPQRTETRSRNTGKDPHPCVQE